MALNSIEECGYWSVFDGDGNKYADCGWQKDAIAICKLHDGEGFTYRHSKKVIDPETVDVKATTEGELSGQQGLPQALERLPFEPKAQQLTQSELQEL